MGYPKLAARSPMTGAKPGRETFLQTRPYLERELNLIASVGRLLLTSIKLITLSGCLYGSPERLVTPHG